MNAECFRTANGSGFVCISSLPSDRAALCEENGVVAVERMMSSFMDVWKRDAEAAQVFMADLASRLSNRVQLTTAGQKAHHFMYYNFVRIHQTLRVTPAMAVGVSDKA